MQLLNVRCVLEEFRGQVEGQNLFVGVGRIRPEYFALEVHTGWDLQGTEYTAGGATHDLEVNFTKVSLRNDSVFGPTVISVRLQGGDADLDGSEGWE